MTTRAWLIRHWLAVTNTGFWIFALLPVMAPALMEVGLPNLAEPIYSLYSLVCHQWAHRSYFLFGPQATYSLIELSQLGPDFSYIGRLDLGYKIAYCERDLAIYLSIAAAGTIFALHRANVRPLKVPLYALLLLPIALDGFTQLVGWRESTPLLRLATGCCFGLATVWFVFPRLDVILRQLPRPTAMSVTRARP